MSMSVASFFMLEYLVLVLVLNNDVISETVVGELHTRSILLIVIGCSRHIC